jgi:purine nucleosidase
MMFPQIDDETRLARLAPPTGKVSIILDTDMANEIDDQFTLAWAFLRPDVIDLQAVIAEPFSFAHHREPLLQAEQRRKEPDGESGGEPVLLEQYDVWAERLATVGTAVSDLSFSSVAEGIDLSVRETYRVFEAAGADPEGLVFRGSDQYMVDVTTPVASEGVDRIVELARAAEDIVYVVAIGCITNVASALLIAPDIADKIVVLWTSGYPSTDHRSNKPSLNLVQDVHATRVVLESGVPYIYMPGYLIGQQLTVSQPEMHEWVRGTGPLGDLLVDLYDNNPLYPMFGIDGHFGRTWVIWDLICLAWLIDPALVPTVLRPTPELAGDLRWDLQNAENRPLMREAIGVNRDGIFRDLFAKLSES